MINDGAEDPVISLCQFCCIGFGIFNQIRILLIALTSYLKCFRHSLTLLQFSGLQLWRSGRKSYPMLIQRKRRNLGEN